MIDVPSSNPKSTQSLSRYSRQSRLAEVREEGQQCLCEAEARLVSVGVAGVVAARYVAGAGFRRMRVRDDEARAAAHAVAPGVEVTVLVGPARGRPPEAPAWLEMADPAARDVALGAYEALVTIRMALRISPEGS